MLYIIYRAKCGVQSFARERKVVNYRKKQRGSGDGCDESETESAKRKGGDERRDDDPNGDDGLAAAAPKGNLAEIEEAIDERLAKLRGQMLEDAMRISQQAEWSQDPQDQRPRCEHCGCRGFPAESRRVSSRPMEDRT